MRNGTPSHLSYADIIFGDWNSCLNVRVGTIHGTRKLLRIAYDRSLSVVRIIGHIGSRALRVIQLHTHTHTHIYI